MAFLIVGGGLSGGAPTAPPTVSLVNNNAGAVAIGSPVYSVAAGAFDLASNATAAKALVIGLVAAPTIASAASGLVQTGDVLTATAAQWDAVAGTSGGLTFGTIYYLSATPGALTATPPTTVGTWATQVGSALSPTQFSVAIQPAIGAIV